MANAKTFRVYVPFKCTHYVKKEQAPTHSCLSCYLLMNITWEHESSQHMAFKTPDGSHVAQPLAANSRTHAARTTSHQLVSVCMGNETPTSGKSCNKFRPVNAPSSQTHVTERLSYSESDHVIQIQIVCKIPCYVTVRPPSCRCFPYDHRTLK